MNWTVGVAQWMHYVAYGTPGGEHPMACRAAIVTEVGAPDNDGNPRIGLCVVNPTGLFFNRDVRYSTLMDGVQPQGGTWHNIYECEPGPGLGQ